MIPNVPSCMTRKQETKDCRLLSLLVCSMVVPSSSEKILTTPPVQISRPPPSTSLVLVYALETLRLRVRLPLPLPSSSSSQRRELFLGSWHPPCSPLFSPRCSPPVLRPSVRRVLSPFPEPALLWFAQRRTARGVQLSVPRVSSSVSRVSPCVVSLFVCVCVCVLSCLVYLVWCICLCLCAVVCALLGAHLLRAHLIRYLYCVCVCVWCCVPLETFSTAFLAP